MKNNKFELIDETSRVYGVYGTLFGETDVYRIRALKDFNDVKAGELGGFVESEENLSFEENDISWAYDDSVISAHAIVEGDSIVSGNSRVHGSYVGKGSKITNNSEVDGGEIENSTIDSSFSNNSNSFNASIKTSDVHLSTIYDSEIEDSYLYDGYVKDSKMYNDASINEGGIAGESVTAQTHPHIKAYWLYEQDLSESFNFFKPLNEENQDIQLIDDDLSDLNDLDEGLLK